MEQVHAREASAHDDDIDKLGAVGGGAVGFGHVQLLALSARMMGHAPGATKPGPGSHPHRRVVSREVRHTDRPRRGLGRHVGRNTRHAERRGRRPRRAEELLAYFAVTLLVAAEAIFPLLPGKTTVVTAATIASQGDLNIWAVFVAAWLGAMGGDFLLYGIGRLGSDRIVNWASRAVGQDRIDSAGYFFQRYGQPFLSSPAGRARPPGPHRLDGRHPRHAAAPLRPAEILGAGLGPPTRRGSGTPSAPGSRARCGSRSPSRSS